MVTLAYSQIAFIALCIAMVILAIGFLGLVFHDDDGAWLITLHVVFGFLGTIASLTAWLLLKTLEG